MLIILVVKCDIRLLFFEFGVKQMRAMGSRIAIFFFLSMLFSLVRKGNWEEGGG
jgi:hypothetical protein